MNKEKVLLAVVSIIFFFFILLQSTIIKHKNQVIEDKEEKINSLKFYRSVLESRVDEIQSGRESETGLGGLRSNIILDEEICFPTGVDIDIDSDYYFSISTSFCMREDDKVTIGEDTGNHIIRTERGYTTVKQKRTYKLSDLEINFTRENETD